MLQVFSDFILPLQPTSVKEAMKVYSDISQSSGSLENRHKYATPMYVQLTPLKFVS